MDLLNNDERRMRRAKGEAIITSYTCLCGYKTELLATLKMANAEFRMQIFDKLANVNVCKCGVQFKFDDKGVGYKL